MAKKTKEVKSKDEKKKSEVSDVNNKEEEKVKVEEPVVQKSE